jgi:hypothetical protein
VSRDGVCLEPATSRDFTVLRRSLDVAGSETLRVGDNHRLRTYRLDPDAKPVAIEDATKSRRDQRVRLATSAGKSSVIQSFMLFSGGLCSVREATKG